MIARANDLLTATYEVQLDGDGEVLRDAFGAPVLATDADGLPMLREGALETRLTRYVGLLDAARQIGAKLGAGPLSGE
jgi:hypothetical protein